MRAYLDLAERVLKEGKKRADRTKTGVRSLFGVQSRYDLRRGFPLLTTKEVRFKSVLHELLWFLRGENHVDYLHKHGVHIWDHWVDEHGSLGKTYGYQWRRWEGKEGPIDQIARVIADIKRNPLSRRLVVSAWNVSDLEEMVLPPCHVLFQFYVEDGQLSCQLYQRSADIFLGVPFNIASYSLLTMLIAKICCLQAYEFIHTIGDAHLYENHLTQIEEQLTRTPRELPTLRISDEVESIHHVEASHFLLEHYNPHPRIWAKIAI